MKPTMPRRPPAHATIVLASGLLAASGCDPFGAGATKRELYERHALLTDEQAQGILDACPANLDVGADDTNVPPPLLTVRTLTAPQAEDAGVDVRVEFSRFMTHARAECIDDYLKGLGAVEFEGETMHWPAATTTAGSSTSG